MANPKRFDLVTLLGLALAVLMFGLSMYFSNRRQEELRQWQLTQASAQQAEQERLAKEKAAQPKPEEKISPTPDGPEAKQPDLTGKEPKPKPKPEPEPSGDQEAADSGDVTLKGATLELVFTAEGASIRQVILADQYKDAATKQGLGIEMLAEIEKGKRAFNMPVFDVGPPDPERAAERQVFDQPAGPLKALSRRVWKLAHNSGGFDSAGNWTLSYSVRLQDRYELTKTFTVSNHTNLVKCDITVKNETDTPVNFSYALTGPAGVLLEGTKTDPSLGAYVYIRAELAGREASASGRQDDSIEIKQVSPETAIEETDATAISYGQNLWGAVKNRFYIASLISVVPDQLIKLRAIGIKHDPNASDLRFAQATVGVEGVRRKTDPLAGKSAAKPDEYVLYVGPADESRLNILETSMNLPTPYHLSEAIQYCDLFGWRWPRVDWVARKMIWLFQALHGLFGSYGMAVILLTLVIKLLLHPMQRKMNVSMYKMSKLQPELKKIQEKYKNQTTKEAKQKMFLEQQDMMRKAGANPVAGCLPILLQIPIFSALYGIFNRAFDIRGAEFLWINDLAQQDRAFALPFWPHWVNLLPLVYMAVTILQTKFTPTPKSEDPVQEQQRKMMMFMPIIFSLMFYRMPSGLVLYFAASAIFGIIETWYIRTKIIKDEPPPPTGKAATKPPPAVVKTKPA